MNVFRMMVAERIRSLAAFHSGSQEGGSSMRWNGSKELLYELVNGPFQPNEKERTKKAKYLSLDLTTFHYESLDDSSLLMMFENVCRRHNTCM